MGQCQCIETADLFLGELNGTNKSKNFKKNNIKEALANESTPMKASFDDYNLYTNDKQKSYKNTTIIDKDNYDNKNENYQTDININNNTYKQIDINNEIANNPQINNKVQLKKVSNYTLFQNNYKKANNLNLAGDSCTKDNIVFEEYSNISKSMDTVNCVDYYQVARNLFETINNIRQKPNSYYELLNNVFSNINEKSENEHLNEFKAELKKVPEDKRNMILNILQKNENENNCELIMWSEKVYLSISQYLIKVEEKCTITSDKNSSIRISEKLKGNYLCTEFNLNGLYQGEILLWKFLFENLDRINLILDKNYQNGAICCYQPKNSHKLRTLMYLISKNTDVLNNTYLTYIDNNSKISLNSFVLKYNCRDLFNEYLDLIVGGEYFVNDNSVDVKLYLYTGEQKEEIIQL